MPDKLVVQTDARGRTEGIDDGGGWDAAVIGGGAVGLATARALVEDHGRRVVVLEAEGVLAAHQTGHNSGVIHSGLYYRPGSLKAQLCAEGREELYRFCVEEGLPHERCGKIVVAVDPGEIPALEELERRGRANGLEGLRRLGPDEIPELEPRVRGVEGLHVPQTGIVDFAEVARACARRIVRAGGCVRTGFAVRAVRREGDAFVLSSRAGPAVTARRLVNCAGLQCDRVARLCGLRPEVRIVPFRGAYFRLRPEAEHLVRNLVYPVPDPRFPFLGVHFTRMIGGGVEAGPNAVLALKREGYRARDVSLRDLGAMGSYPGFWRMAARYGRTGSREFARSLSTRAFVRALQRLVPDIRVDDVERHGAGVRAQAVGRDGRLLDDFCIQRGPGMVHVLNAPSPAATASLAIGRRVAEWVEEDRA